MKRKTMILFSVIFIIIISIILAKNTFSYAKVTTNDPTVESNGEVKITVSTTTAVSCFKIQLIDAGGLTFQSAVKSSNFDNGSSNGSTINGATTGQPSTILATYTFKAPEVTETKKYNIKFSISNMDKEEDTTNTSTVTVKAKEQKPVQPENPTTQNPTTEKPTNPTVTEPKFESTNKTMYATKVINLRSSWSTSSSATEIAKGTELTITGTSTEKVDGYVWYRVNYNGTTKYVASNLLTSTKPKEEEKSNNANLKSLTVENQELTPKFSSAITSYTVEIAKDITKLELKAEPEDAKAKVTVQGNEELKEGENNIVISVSAEDGTVKQYEIKAIREAETKTLGLQSLKIKNTNIEAIFKPEQYDYEIEIKEETKLEIEAIANDEMATVEILGNEDLQEGENVITIMVSSQDGTQKVTYQIKANKIASVTPSVAKQIDVKLYIYIAIGAILLIALIIVIVYTITHRNQEEYEYTDNIEELPEKKEEQELEETQEINDANKEEQDIVEEEPEEKKPKIDYFLEKEETPKRKKGKHF